MVSKKIIVVMIVLSIIFLVSSFLISIFTSSESLNVIKNEKGDSRGSINLVVYPPSPVVSENG